MEMLAAAIAFLNSFPISEFAVVKQLDWGAGGLGGVKSVAQGFVTGNVAIDSVTNIGNIMNNNTKSNIIMGSSVACITGSEAISNIDSTRVRSTSNIESSSRSSDNSNIKKDPIGTETPARDLTPSSNSPCHTNDTSESDAEIDSEESPSLNSTRKVFLLHAVPVTPTNKTEGDKYDTKYDYDEKYDGNKGDKRDGKGNKWGLKADLRGGRSIFGSFMAGIGGDSMLSLIPSSLPPSSSFSSSFLTFSSSSSFSSHSALIVPPSKPITTRVGRPDKKKLDLRLVSQQDHNDVFYNLEDGYSGDITSKLSFDGLSSSPFHSSTVTSPSSKIIKLKTGKVYQNVEVEGSGAPSHFICDRSLRSRSSELMSNTGSTVRANLQFNVMDEGGGYEVYEKGSEISEEEEERNEVEREEVCEKDKVEKDMEESRERKGGSFTGNRKSYDMGQSHYHKNNNNNDDNNNNNSSNNDNRNDTDRDGHNVKHLKYNMGQSHCNGFKSISTMQVTKEESEKEKKRGIEDFEGNQGSAKVAPIALRKALGSVSKRSIPIPNPTIGDIDDRTPSPSLLNPNSRKPNPTLYGESQSKSHSHISHSTHVTTNNSGDKDIHSRHNIDHSDVSKRSKKSNFGGDIDISNSSNSGNSKEAGERVGSRGRSREGLSLSPQCQSFRPSFRGTSPSLIKLPLGANINIKDSRETSRGNDMYEYNTKDDTFMANPSKKDPDPGVRFLPPRKSPAAKQSYLTPNFKSNVNSHSNPDSYRSPNPSRDFYYRSTPISYPNSGPSRSTSSSPISTSYPNKASFNPTSKPSSNHKYNTDFKDNLRKNYYPQQYCDDDYHNKGHDSPPDSALPVHDYMNDSVKEERDMYDYNAYGINDKRQNDYNALKAKDDAR
jgi:hypothetical protein